MISEPRRSLGPQAQLPHPGVVTRQDDKMTNPTPHCGHTRRHGREKKPSCIMGVPRSRLLGYRTKQVGKTGFAKSYYTSIRQLAGCLLYVSWLADALQIFSQKYFFGYNHGVFRLLLKYLREKKPQKNNINIQTPLVLLPPVVTMLCRSMSCHC